MNTLAYAAAGASFVMIQNGVETPPQDIQPVPPAINVQDRHVAEDERKRYVLMQPFEKDKAPEQGFKLLLVLPGGDGSAEFQPFVTAIYRQALPEGYVLAQLVAPQWSEQQAQHIVWPTKSSQMSDVKFTTEAFINAVIDDVQTQVKIDRRFIFTLSWSSGGPAAYAASLDEDSRITGSIVAMSVFKPEQLPDLANAKGKAYYILHSPGDFIPMRFPQAARDQLATNGAATTLVTYEGGHGWVGDAFAMIRAGVTWLESQMSPRE